MKKVFLSFFLAASFYGASAQVQFGAKAGLNLASLTGDDVDVKSKIGFNAGLFAEIPVSEQFSVKPELVYSLQGAKSDGEGDSKLNLSYLNIPILAKYNISEGFFAEAGPQIGFLTTAKAKYDGGSVDIKDNFKSIDFSLGLGLGYELSETYGLNLRYNLGLSSIADDDDAKVKNSVFQLGIFYKFGGSN